MSLEQDIRAFRLRVEVTSFGYGHDVEHDARQHLTYDVRTFRDPLGVDGLRELTGRDGAVREHVLTTPGVSELVDMIVRQTAEYVRLFGDPYGLLTRVAIGCGGGRHRAPVIAHEVATALTRAGVGADAIHRDIDRPVLAS